MKFLSNLRSKVENWLINDTLNNTNFTNINNDSNSFVEKFGLHQLCLLEMFDAQSQCFYGSDTAGFGFLLKSKQYTQDQYQTLSELVHHIDAGYGLQITSMESVLLVSVSCNVAFTNTDDVEAMQAVQTKLFELLDACFDVEHLTAQSLINIASNMLYPHRALNDGAEQLIYDDLFFVRDQLANYDDVAVEVKKSSISYQKQQERFTAIGFGVQRYYDANISPAAEEYQRFIDSKLASMQGAKAYFTLGVYKPVKSKKPKEMSLYEHQHRQKLRVCHIFTVVSKEHDATTLTKIATDAIRLFDYQIVPLHNRQLAALFFGLPICLGLDTAEDIYNLRLCKSVDLVHHHDVFPVIYNLVAHNDKEI